MIGVEHPSGNTRNGKKMDRPMDSPLEILDRTTRLYATCDAYRDRGEVVSEVEGIRNPDRITHWTQPFWTVFRRPGDFRFEYRHAFFGTPDIWEREIIGRFKGRTWHLSTTRLDKNMPTELVMMVASLTGVSGGSACRIPRMLMPEELRFAKRVSIPDAILTADEEVEGEHCRVVKIRIARGMSETFWISARSGLIHKVLTRFGPDPELTAEARRAMEEVRRDFKRKYPDLDLPPDEDEERRTVSTTRYYPELAPSVTDEELNNGL
jgi:hypothetical protein